LSDSYSFKLPPYEHQREALRRARGRRYFAFLMEMGTGKTKVVIDELCQLFLSGEIDGAIILAPKGVYMNWLLREIPTHMPDCVRLRAIVVEWRPGAGPQYHRRLLRSLCDPADGRLRVLIMNVEALSAPGDLALKFAHAFLARRRAYAACDESTTIKTWDSLRTGAAVTIGQRAAFSRILTGSPVTRAPLDLYSQFEFLRAGLLGQSYWAFRARYAVLKKMPFTGHKRQPDGSVQKRTRAVVREVGWRNLEELNQKLDKYSFRVRKDECLDLPPKVYLRRDVELTAEQRRVYAELREFAIAELDEISMVTAPQIITRLLRLHQVVCGHVTDDDGTVRELPSERPAQMLEVLAETSGKAIIWSRWRPDIDRIVRTLTREYGEGSVAQFHGGNVGTRETEATRWLNAEDCRFMVSNQQTGGYGNTWLPGRTVIYYSNSHNLEHRLQSEDRPHRAGQTETVTYVDLVAPGTVEEKILAALRAKIDIASTVLGDGYREWLI